MPIMPEGAALSAGSMHALTSQGKQAPQSAAACAPMPVALPP